MNKRQRKKRSKKQVKPIPLKDLQKKTPKQLNQYKPERLRKTYQQLRATAKKRLDRLEKAGFTDENIYKQYRFAFENPSRDLTDSEIKQKILELRKFLSTKESTVRGQKQKQKALEDMANFVNDILNNKDNIIDDTAEIIPEMSEPDINIPDINPDDITGYTDFIDTNDEKVMAQWGDFMDSLRYSLNAEILYDIGELFELWETWQQTGRHLGKFNKAPEQFQRKWNKFRSSQRTRIKRSSKSKNVKDSEQRRIDKITGNNKKK